MCGEGSTDLRLRVLLWWTELLWWTALLAPTGEEKGKPAGRRNGQERGGDDGFEMAGLQGEKKSKKMGDFCSLVLFERGLANGWSLRFQRPGAAIGEEKESASDGWRKKFKPGGGGWDWVFFRFFVV